MHVSLLADIEFQLQLAQWKPLLRNTLQDLLLQCYCLVEGISTEHEYEPLLSVKFPLSSQTDLIVVKTVDKPTLVSFLYDTSLHLDFNGLTRANSDITSSKLAVMEACMRMSYRWLF
jgi:hypothetical protein